METQTLPEQQEQDGAPAEEGAEATRSTAHLFQHSTYVHAGDGAEECQHREDGKCTHRGHFHAWLTLPNSIQHRDIQEKARAAKARKKRALRDAGDEKHPASDSYVSLESELDDLLMGDPEPIINGLADRAVRERFGEIALDVKEEDRFENLTQDKEEFTRMAQMDPDDRPTEEWEQLDRRMSEFASAIDKRVEDEREREKQQIAALSPDQIREQLRESRISGEGNEASTVAYYTWMAFVGTRKCPGHRTAPRYYATMDEFRLAAPEAIDTINEALRDLEARTLRGGDASGN